MDPVIKGKHFDQYRVIKAIVPPPLEIKDADKLVGK